MFSHTRTVTALALVSLVVLAGCMVAVALGRAVGPKSRPAVAARAAGTAPVAALGRAAGRRPAHR